MAFRNLQSDLAEMFGGLSAVDYDSAPEHLGPAFTVRPIPKQTRHLSPLSDRERARLIPETRAQKQHRRRLERARRVEGLVRGQRCGP